MKIKLVVVSFLLQLFYTKMFAGSIDTTGGIQFETQATWRQVLAKAKAEDKMIFVDCYATWCGPCKRMDRDVYTRDSVARVFNKAYICVKIQMDSTQQDDESTRKRYPDAEFLRKKFVITGYPTFLFFGPDGQLVDHRMGAMDAAAFLRMGIETEDPNTRYDILLNRFRKGERELLSMRALIWTALRLRDTSVAKEVVGPYFHDLNAQDWFVPNNIRLLNVYTRSSRDSGFRFFYLHSGRIDTIMESDVYAEDVVQVIIVQEIVKSWWIKSKDSDTLLGCSVWANQIAEKYGKYYSNRVLLCMRMQHALRKRRWLDYTHDLTVYMNKYGPHKDPSLDLVLNNSAWVIFQHSSDSVELEQALSWSSQALLLNADANYMDTYANICYKRGRRDKGIMWEEVAVRLEPENKSFRENLIKMRDKKPTWPVQ